MTSSDEAPDDVSVTEPRPARKRRPRQGAKRATGKRAEGVARADVREHDARVGGAPTMPKSVMFGLVGGGMAACLGIALVATGPSVAGMWTVVASIVVLVASIHRLGRLGPEPAEARPPRSAAARPAS